MISRSLKRFLTRKWISYEVIKLLFPLALLPTHFYSQTVKLKGIIGTSNISGDISPNEAKKEALTNAKINCLLKAGVSENINSYQTLYTNQSNNKFEQLFTSESQSQLQGNIKSYSIVNEKIYCKNEFEIVYEIVINAEVIKYKSEIDNKFQVNIENLKNTYNVGDDFSFQFKSTVDCYLTIFDLLDTTAALVYPRNESSKKIIKNKVIKFPYEGALNTELSPGNVTTSEPHRLLLVFSKEAYPFILHDTNYFTSYEKVIGWVNSIEPSQKNIQYYGFQIIPR